MRSARVRAIVVLGLLTVLPALAGCGRAAASVSYNPFERLESSDGRWVYFLVLPARRSYYAKNVVDHRLIRDEAGDFVLIEGVDNWLHHGWARLIGLTEAIFFIPSYLLVQLENLAGVSIILFNGANLAELTNFLIYPIDWALHDVPVTLLSFFLTWSPEASLRARDDKPLIVARARYPANPESYVFFLWPWFQPGYVGRGSAAGKATIDERELELSERLAAQPVAPSAERAGR